MHQMVLSSGQGSQERAEETQKPADIPSPLTTHTASHLHIVLPAEMSHLPLLSARAPLIIQTTQAPTFAGNLSLLSQIAESPGSPHVAQSTSSWYGNILYLSEPLIRVQRCQCCMH